MDEQDTEDTFLMNATLGADPDLVTSYVAATDDEPKKASGCLTVVLVVIAAA